MVFPDAQSPLYAKHLSTNSTKKDLNCGRGVSYLIFLRLNITPNSTDARWAILSLTTFFRLSGNELQIASGITKGKEWLKTPCFSVNTNPFSTMSLFT